MFKNKINFKLVNFALLTLIIYFMYNTSGFWGSFLNKIFKSVMPFFIAFVLAYALYPFVKKLEAKGIRKSLAVSFVATAILILVVSILVITLPIVYEQLIGFSKAILTFIGDVSSKFDVDLGDFQLTITDTMNELIRGLGKYVSDGTLIIVNKSIDVLTKAIIIYIVSIYFLYDMESIRGRVKKFLKKQDNRFFQYVKTIDYEMSQYFTGLAILMVVQLFEYGILFKIANHPNWILLAVLASVTTVIPYFGGIFTNIVAVVTASVAGTYTFVASIIICLIFSNVDGYIISPKIYGKTNNIKPLPVMFAVFAGGVIYGFIGIAVSLPLLIILTSTYHFFREEIHEKVRSVKDSIE